MCEYKLKAEAYVREYCPELMETTAGCQLRYETLGKELNADLVVTPFHVVKDDRVLFLSGIDAFLCVGRVIEIIGHPIQLQHWLRVLNHAESKDYSYFLRGEYWLQEYNHGDLRDVETMLRFDLTIGQPATEEDYKVFCEIVGA